mmetsp:Transcript_107915/g.344472  ORF Transcript_107915/g.344472 Transcript_107915/m.344472 type:complete len:151 (-) Transcript_107915:26-478(-)
MCGAWRAASTRQLRLAEAAAYAAGSTSVRGTPEVPTAEEHIAQVVELCGALPDALLREGQRSKQLLRAGADAGVQGTAEQSDTAWSLCTAGLALGDLPRCGLLSRLEEYLSAEDASQVDQLLGPMLRVSPSARATPQVLLEDLTWLWENS